MSWRDIMVADFVGHPHYPRKPTAQPEPESGCVDNEHINQIQNSAHEPDPDLADIGQQNSEHETLPAFATARSQYPWVGLETTPRQNPWAGLGIAPKPRAESPAPNGANPPSAPVKKRPKYMR